LLPELDVTSRIAFANARFGELAIQPRVHEGRQHTGFGFLVAKRHLSIGERALLFGATRYAMTVAVQSAKAVVGAEIVNH
jgi:hypothetical protein